jgi:hypothetical protein
MFIETSAGSAGSVSYLEFPEFNTSSLMSAELRFFYHMYGATTNKLVVESYNGTSWVAIDSLVGQQQTASADPWLERVVSVPTAASVKIRFAGYRGTSFTGDISIDNVSVQEPVTCSNADQLTVSGGVSCNGDPAVFTATGAASGNTVLWMNGNNAVVASGDSLTLNSPVAGTVYNAASFADDTTKAPVSFGPPTTLTGGFGNFTNGQWFTALAPFRLDSISVISNGSRRFNCSRQHRGVDSTVKLDFSTCSRHTPGSGRNLLGSWNLLLELHMASGLRASAPGYRGWNISVHSGWRCDY